MIRAAALCFALCLGAWPALASPDDSLGVQTEGEVLLARLVESLQIDAVIDVVRAEGLASVLEMEIELSGGFSGSAWNAVVEKIYDAQVMHSEFGTVFAARMTREHEILTPALAFYASDLGRRILRLEIEARLAMLDEQTEADAARAYDRLVQGEARRAYQLERFVAMNDLVESNVEGAMNANLAFLRAFSRAGAPDARMTEAEMLAEVWSQEADTRLQTVDWLFPFLTLAYETLSDDELEDYIAFSHSPAGQEVNSALVAAFDAVFIRLSTDLGTAAAHQMQGNDI